MLSDPVVFADTAGVHIDASSRVTTTDAQATVFYCAFTADEMMKLVNFNGYVESVGNTGHTGASTTDGTVTVDNTVLPPSPLVRTLMMASRAGIEHS